MKCPQCGKSSNVTIGSRVYCTSCGAVISGEKPSTPDKTTPAKTEKSPEIAPAPQAPTIQPDTTAPAAEMPPPTAPAAPRRMDIAAPGASMPPVAAAPSPTSRPVVAPITSGRTMSDVVAPVAKPAAAYHNPAEAPAAAISEPTPAVQSSPAPATPLVPIAEHTSVPVPSAPATSDIASSRLAAAQAVAKSQSIVKFHEPVAAEPVPAVAVAEPVTEPTPVVSSPAPQPDPVPALTQLPEAQTVAPAPVDLPAPTATQHEAMQNLIEQPKPSRDDAFKLAMEAATAAAKPNPVAVGAAAMAVVVMGGYIWLQNYPRMQLSAVSGKAGFTASLPGYLPSSYALNGKIDAKPGQVSMRYAAPGLPALTIDQKLTSWDSSSLLDNYVAAQDPSFATVQGQGLTIYTFGNGQAAWVNHGIWYSITGATRLSRDQLIKLADSL